MADKYSWSASAGRWFGVPVRLHVLLFLFIATTFGVQWYVVDPHLELMGTAFVTSLVLLFSILAHELAHVFTITNLGGHVNNVVLAPWGGLSNFKLPDRAVDRVWSYAAGPFAGAAIFGVAAALLSQSGHQTDLSALINPFRPHAFIMSDLWAVSLAKIIAWVNFQLFIVNLIPAFPFDGQGMLRALIDMVNPGVSALRRESTLMAFGHAVGFTQIGCAWFLKDTSGGVFPPTMILLLGGIATIFAARYNFDSQLDFDDDWDEFDDFDYESLYGELEFSEGGIFETGESEIASYSQWLVEKQEERTRMEEEIEQREEMLVDDILKKLHHDGLDSLSEEERSILTRVSERLRRRKQQQEADF